MVVSGMDGDGDTDGLTLADFDPVITPATQYPEVELPVSAYAITK